MPPITGQISPFQFTKAKWNSGMTDSNSLSQALLTQPDISKTIAYAFGDKYHIQYLTMGTGRVANKYTPLGNVEYQWPLMGSLDKAIPITSDITQNGASQPGINFSEFKISVAERWFDVGDNLIFDDRLNVARVQRIDGQVGNSWVYVLRLVTSNPNEWVALSNLDYSVGAMVAKEWTSFEEGSRGGHSTEVAPMWLKNQMSISRHSYSMTGSAQTDVMILQTGRNKKSFLWIGEKEYQQMQIFQMNAERKRWYSRYNRTPDGLINLPGENGRPVLSGGGIFEQLAYSNRRTYTVLTEKIIRSFLTDLQLMSKNADNNKWVAFAGTGAMEDFHQAMKTSLNSSVVVADSVWVTGSGQQLTLGGQFTTYKGLNGTELTLVHCPIFDDPVYNRTINPISGRPLESHKLVLLDFGMYGGESNISMVTKGADGINRSMMMWYEAGSTTPEAGNSGVKNVMRSNDLDGFTCHFLSETGIKIVNPLSCGILECVLS